MFEGDDLVGQFARWPIKVFLDADLVTRLDLVTAGFAAASATLVADDRAGADHVRAHPPGSLGIRPQGHAGQLEGVVGDPAVRAVDPVDPAEALDHVADVRGHADQAERLRPLEVDPFGHLVGQKERLHPLASPGSVDGEVFLGPLPPIEPRERQGSVAEEVLVETVVGAAAQDRHHLRAHPDRLLETLGIELQHPAALREEDDLAVAVEDLDHPVDAAILDREQVLVAEQRLNAIADRRRCRDDPGQERLSRAAPVHPRFSFAKPLGEGATVIRVKQVGVALGGLPLAPGMVPAPVRELRRRAEQRQQVAKGDALDVMGRAMRGAKARQLGRGEDAPATDLADLLDDLGDDRPLSLAELRRLAERADQGITVIPRRAALPDARAVPATNDRRENCREVALRLGADDEAVEVAAAASLSVFPPAQVRSGGRDAWQLPGNADLQVVETGTTAPLIPDHGIHLLGEDRRHEEGGTALVEGEQRVEPMVAEERRR